MASSTWKVMHHFTQPLNDQGVRVKKKNKAAAATAADNSNNDDEDDVADGV